MKINRTEEMNAVVLGLSDDLSGELRALLDSLCNVQSAAGTGTLAGIPADVIFCGTDVSVVQEVKLARPEAPIVVVSRHPEFSGWLDSIEAGAADYCAAPFEHSQLQWILESTTRCSRF